ncbi:MAG TPA: hypothetical protein VN625_01360 [Desulfuromonadaceae bacterium]|nr:hypothetical protein [Desulfuromonadaceae bacterium]
MKNECPDPNLDRQLSDALSRLPDAPMPSNFTARLMQAIDLEESAAQRSVRRWNWHALLPRIAVATAAIMFTGIAVRQYEASSQRHAIADSLAMVSTQPMPSVDALKNFDVIRRMSQPAHADDELLALLQ